MIRTTLLLVVHTTDAGTIDTTGETVEDVVRHIPITKRPIRQHDARLREALDQLEKWAGGL